MYVGIAIIASVLSVTLWCMDSAAALKCNGYKLKSLLPSTLTKVVYIGGEAWYVNIQDSRLGQSNFLNSSLK